MVSPGSILFTRNRCSRTVRQLHGAHGFTLIEISIVITIIALIVGGVLVGRDLIRAAEIRATIRQFEQFNAAANAFRLKYGCLPGDCASASALGFNPATDGTGDGTIGCASRDVALCSGTDSDSGIVPGVQTAEYLNFWYHLSAAQLIGGAFPPYDVNTTEPKAGILTPAPKITPSIVSYPSLPGSVGWVIRGDAHYFDWVGPQDAYFPAHSFALARLAAISNTDNGQLFLPADTYAIDAKMDDGLPLSGSVRGWDSELVWSDPGIAYRMIPVRYCMDILSSYPYPYNVAPRGFSLSQSGRCSLLLKAAF